MVLFPVTFSIFLIVSLGVDWFQPGWMPGPAAQPADPCVGALPLPGHSTWRHAITRSVAWNHELTNFPCCIV